MNLKLNIPGEYLRVLQPLFDAFPLSQSMTQLVVTQGGPSQIVSELVRHPLIKAKPPLIAGLWLYADQLDASHVISQAMENPTGSFWHGIMHRREGDFGNSHYWFRKVGAHPALKRIDDYDPHQFIDDVERAHAKGASPAVLIDRQRREWIGLFEWCVQS